MFDKRDRCRNREKRETLDWFVSQVMYEGVDRYAWKFILIVGVFNDVSALFLASRLFMTAEEPFNFVHEIRALSRVFACKSVDTEACLNPLTSYAQRCCVFIMILRVHESLSVRMPPGGRASCNFCELKRYFRDNSHTTPSRILYIVFLFSLGTRTFFTV